VTDHSALPGCDQSLIEELQDPKWKLRFTVSQDR